MPGIKPPPGWGDGNRAFDASGGVLGGELELKSPAFTYDGSGRVSRIDYASGAAKTFVYTGDSLTRIDTLNASAVLVSYKVFAYTGGVLSSITETEP
jgi:hypothetical protein